MPFPPCVEFVTVRVIIGRYYLTLTYPHIAPHSYWDVFTRYVKAIREVVEGSKPANIIIVLNNFNLWGW